jgi:hypothetical protein
VAEPSQRAKTSPAGIAVFTVFAAVVTLAVVALGVVFLVWGVSTLLARPRTGQAGGGLDQES